MPRLFFASRQNRAHIAEAVLLFKIEKVPAEALSCIGVDGIVNPAVVHAKAAGHFGIDGIHDCSAAQRGDIARPAGPEVPAGLICRGRHSILELSIQIWGSEDFMTPAELNKALTLLLHERLADTGFSKKKIGTLRRKADECEQFLTFYLTRDCGLPGNRYSLTATLSFSFPEIDRLTCEFLGKEDDRGFGTGAQPLYTVVPGRPVLKYKHCSDEPLDRLAKMVSEDFHAYALPFYENYDTPEKLAEYFERERLTGEYGFRVVISGQKPGSGHGCCIAAVLCLLERWDALEQFLRETKFLTDECKERIRKYLPAQ